MSVLDFYVIPKKINYHPEDKSFVETADPCLPNCLGIRFCIDESEVNYWSHKEEKSRIIMLSEVADSFINLPHSDIIMIKSFLENYGMLRIAQVVTEDRIIITPPTEALADIGREVMKYRETFAKLSALKKNQPTFEGVSENSAYSMFEVLSSINTVVSQLQHSLYIDADDDKPFFTEYIACHSLLHALYFFLYQNALHDWYKYSVCADCGKRFLSSNHKKITNKCPGCIKQNRIVRNKEQQRGNPRQYYKEKMHNRARHYLVRQRQIYFDVLDDWLRDVFDKEFLDVKDSSDIEFSNWENKKEKEWKELLKRNKSSHQGD